MTATADLSSRTWCEEDGEWAELDTLSPWDEAVFSDDELLLGVAGPVQASDLMLLASIDPASLSTPRAKLAYELRASK